MPFDYHCHVIDHRAVGTGLRVLTLQPVYNVGDPPFTCQAGQFVMVDLPTDRFFFRRPFSVLAVYEDGVFELFYKVVGQGTQIMASLQPGDELNVLGPLGNIFSPLKNPASTLLIGGGIGIAPMFCLAKELIQAGQLLPTCLYGVRSQQDIGLLRELSQLFGPEKLCISTDDGSYGFTGNICQLLESRPELSKEIETAYICGPTRMMEAAARLLTQTNPHIHIEVSLEEHMPCGTGACTGCVVHRTDQTLPSKTCVEGPVFNAKSIQWPDGAIACCEMTEESACSL
jgi:dihydroorotate dehydrogenase electron transfer subunit